MSLAASRLDDAERLRELLADVARSDVRGTGAEVPEVAADGSDGRDGSVRGAVVLYRVHVAGMRGHVRVRRPVVDVVARPLVVPARAPRGEEPWLAEVPAVGRHIRHADIAVVERVHF